MVAKNIEIEAKYSVDASTEIPDLASLPGVTSAEQTTRHEMSATYFDTQDLRLTHSKITLRHRSGGKDAGWHVKLPGGLGRIELTVEESRQTTNADDVHVPGELLSQLRAIVRDHPLIPIATVDNARDETLLTGDNGEIIAEFCDDHVTATSHLPGGITQRWREWELELTTTDAKVGKRLLKQAKKLFSAAGAHPSDSPSKLVSALGDSLATAPLPPHVEAVKAHESDSAVAAVVNTLTKSRNALVEWDPKVRRDEFDSVHQMRVATRELRSHFSTFDGIIAGASVDELAEQLKEFAALMGVARDAEVVRDRFIELFDADDTGLVTLEDREKIIGAMDSRYTRAHARIIAEMNSTSYFRMLDALDNILLHPPVVSTSESNTSKQAKESGKDTSETLAKHLDKAFNKTWKRHEKALKYWNDPEKTRREREEYYHDVRKSIKKLRYATQAVGNATDINTKKLVKATKKIQTLLGEFQDSVTSRDTLLSLAWTAQYRGEKTFIYGMLYEREKATGDACLAQYNEAAADLAKTFHALRGSKRRKR